MFVDEDDDVPAVQKTNVKEKTSIRYYSVELPSNGKLGYSSEVEYRDILVGDEKILSTATGKNYQKVLGKILKSLLKDSDIYDSLTIYDRDFLLLWIWANNYSTKKEFEITCPLCGEKDNVIIDMTEIDINEISDEYDNSFELHISNGDTVKLRLITTRDEMIADEFISKNKEYYADYIKLVLSMDFGKVMPLPQKIKYVEENFTGRDMGFVRAFHEYFQYGIDDKMEHNCPSCEGVTSHEIPFSFEIFLPTLRDDFKKMLQSNKKSRNKSN